MGLVVQEELSARLYFEWSFFYGAVLLHFLFGFCFDDRRAFVGFELFAGGFLVVFGKLFFGSGKELGHLGLTFLDGEVWTSSNFLTSDLSHVEFSRCHLNVRSNIISLTYINFVIWIGLTLWLLLTLFLRLGFRLCLLRLLIRWYHLIILIRLHDSLIWFLSLLDCCHPFSLLILRYCVSTGHGCPFWTLLSFFAHNF